MKIILYRKSDGRPMLEEVPPPVLRDGGVVVRTCYSLISSGTERAKLELGQKGLVGKAAARPQLVQQVLESVRQEGLRATYDKVRNQLDRYEPLGYSSSGIVWAVGRGAEEFRVGDRVACAGGGYANHADFAFIPRNLCARVPDSVPLEVAAFATIGAIALQGLRQAELVLGENVAVIGLGLVGQLTAQLCKAAGCRVLGMDRDAARSELARKLGIDEVVLPGNDPVSAARAFSPQGVDVALITAATPSSEPVEVGTQLLRDRGRVVIVGEVGMELSRALFYEKELELRLSRSYGPGRYDPAYEELGIDYPVGYVRWTEKRNIEAFLQLLGEKKIALAPLITHRFSSSNAAAAYDLIGGKKSEPFLGVLLEHASESDAAEIRPDRLTVRVKTSQPKQPAETAQKVLRVGFIGAGNFARRFLLPNLKRQPQVQFSGVATATGYSAKEIADRWKFQYATSAYEEILQDTETQVVIIATRHNLHADLVARALEAGKAVFVEKPLALTDAELIRVVRAYRTREVEGKDPRLLIGFNRRFSRAARELKALFADRREPLIALYRVNAGYIPSSHWTQDPREGGGRIIGEICHFVDLLIYLTGSAPVNVTAVGLPNLGRYRNDNLTATLEFEDGSLGTIVYCANGDRSMPKERVEAFSQGVAAWLEDFRFLVKARNGKYTKQRFWQAGKGHRQEIERFVRYARGQEDPPISFREMVAASCAVFRIEQALAEGTKVPINLLSFLTP